MSTITWLLDRMRERAESPALVWQDQAVSYGALLERVAAWHDALDQLGVAQGQVVALEGDYSPQAVSLLLALIERDAIVVPLTASVAAHRAEFLATAEVQLAIRLDDADGWHVERGVAEVASPLTRQLIASGRPGLVLFSSGSTGKSKAALHDFAAMLEKFKPPRHSWCTLTFLLLDHIGGINTLFYTLANGGKVVVVTSRDPELVCQAIARHRVELLPTSPTFLNLLLISEAYTRHDLSSLRRITYGTEPMPQSTLERIHAHFPAVELQQTYGLSELGILRSKSKDSDSLWMRVGGREFETKVVDGVLWVRAQSAMLGYLNAPSPFDSEGWMNTQDEVEVDGDYIRVLGRRSEIINVGGQKVHPAEVESVLSQVDNIRDVAVYGEPNPVTGCIVVARVNLFRPEPPGELRRRIRAYCKGRLATYKVPARIEVTQDDQFSARYKKLRRANSE